MKLHRIKGPNCDDNVIHEGCDLIWKWIGDMLTPRYYHSHGFEILNTIENNSNFNLKHDFNFNTYHFFDKA